MIRYDYLIVGGGMTADAATRGVREVDSGGSIGVIGAEAHAPYDRPPLSKGLWKGGGEDRIWRGTAELGTDLHLGRRIVALDPGRKAVRDDRGTVYGYGKLLLATGGRPRRPWPEGERVVYFRTVEDYRRVRALADAGARFAVIGGGFIGSEMAAALRMYGCDVRMLMPEAGPGARIFPPDLADFLAGFYREKGVEVVAGEGVRALEAGAEEVVIGTTAGRELVVDAVVAGLGIEPSIELAAEAGLEVGNGIVVDEFLRTSDPEVYAAGDVASFHNPSLGLRLRVEHEDNANTMGHAAGRAMAGEGEPYYHLPFFYSDLFELGYEAVGSLDAGLKMVADWKEPYREGVLYYLKGGRVCGALLWNVWGQVDAARALIAEPGPHHPESLKARLPA
ncbi:MAG: FAD-dependent oxidoreductase [Gemmatimonadetes bacterium]|nr:FAD-dependent oxidoreductase [Gemmatimonadota bacterium]